MPTAAALTSSLTLATSSLRGAPRATRTAPPPRPAGTTPTRYSFHIGESTNHGRYVALVFQADVPYCVHGEEVATLAKATAFREWWLASDANA